MKRTLSLVLCIAMLLSIFSIAGVAATADASSLFTVKASTVSNNKITYTVYLKAGVTISGAVIHAKYNTADLQPVDASACTFEGPDGDEYVNVSGVYEAGKHFENANIYSIGYTYGGETDYKIGSSAKAFVQFTFKTINSERPATKVEFYCDEFASVNTPDSNIASGSSAPITSLSSKTLGATALANAESVKGGVKVTWNATTGADNYTVYRKAAGETKWSVIAEGITGTSYTDTNVSNNVSYTYTVRSYNESGIDATYNSTKTTTYFVAPSKITATTKVNSVLVSWSKVAGATAYRVYRRVINEDGTRSGWTTVAKTVKTTSFTDTYKLASDTKYEYTVRTYGKGGQSATYVLGSINYVGTPVVTVKAVYSGVQIKWTAVAGAVKYRIYRKLSGGGYEKLVDVKSNVTSYVDKKAPNNKTIAYTVKAITNEATGSYKGVAVKYLKAPDATVTNTGSGVKISWKKIPGATQYYLYRKAGNATSWTRIAKITGTSYVDKNVKNKTKYTYTVKAYNGSYYSAYNTAGDVIYFVSTPKMGTPVSSKTGITVKWNAVSGVSGYIVYRKTGSGSYSKIATVKGAAQKSYVDKTAKKGVTYTYAVKAYYGSYTSSHYSKTIKDKY